MSPDTEAAIIANDLDSLALRIQALPNNAKFADAFEKVGEAHRLVEQGREALADAAAAEREEAPRREARSILDA